jgi:hypothetical protein
MSGGYFSCGNWMGDDKTGSAFFEVLDNLEDVVTSEERPLWDAEFAAPLRAQLDELDEDEPPFMELSRQMMDVLVPPARRYFQLLNERLGHPDPDTWPEIGERKTGAGWELMCLEDLFRAYDACCKSNESVTVHFD